MKKFWKDIVAMLYLFVLAFVEGFSSILLIAAGTAEDSYSIWKKIALIAAGIALLGLIIVFAKVLVQPANKLNNNRVVGKVMSTLAILLGTTLVIYYYVFLNVEIWREGLSYCMTASIATILAAIPFLVAVTLQTIAIWRKQEKKVTVTIPQEKVDNT